MSQVVAYKRLKIMKNYNAVTSKSRRGRLIMGGGRLREVITHVGSTIYSKSFSPEKVKKKGIIPVYFENVGFPNK